MADQRLFERFIPPWRRWVDERLTIWSHVHVSGLLLGNGDDWACVTAVIALADDDRCQSPAGVAVHSQGEACAFRVALPIEALGRLIEGLGVGEWPSGTIPEVPERIRFNLVEGKRLEPQGEARLETPSMGPDVSQAYQRWPRYTIELQGPPPHEWIGQERYSWIETIDRRLMGAGKPGLGELGSLFGTFVGTAHVSSFWNVQSAVRLVAPVSCRMNQARWVPDRREFAALLELGRLVPRDRVQVLLHDPYKLGLRPPVGLPSGSDSKVEVPLGQDQPSDRAEVRLLAFGEVLQTERAGPGIFSAQGLFADLTVRDNQEPSEEADQEGPGGWFRMEDLASGGQGKVSRARKNGQIGALKEVREGRSDPVRLTRLRREIGFLRRFKRLPFLIRLLDASAEDDEIPYLVTELAPLGSAEDQKGILKGDTWRVLRLARDVALALDGLHAAEVIHRDTKPPNILLFSADQVALADLGVAYDAGQTGITTFNELVESGWFSPPEHAERGRPTAAYDTFMLGKTIYYLLTGGLKYRDHDFATPEWSVRNVVSDAAVRPLEDLLQTLVAPNPRDRLKSMSEVIRALDETLVTVFSGHSGVGFCTSCGRGKYIRAGELSLTQAHLHVNLPDGTQEHLGDRRLTLDVCPECGHCALRAKGDAKMALTRARE